VVVIRIKKYVIKFTLVLYIICVVNFVMMCRYFPVFTTAFLMLCKGLNEET
jgi:hypothetical protein